MNLRHLHAFLVLAEELHFGRTAARLHVVQSAVTQTIQALEKDLGVRLFERNKRRVALTPAGEHFLAHARDAVERLERGSEAARRAAAGESGRLALRFTMMTALTVLPRAVARFQRERPDVQLDIQAGGTTEQLAELRAGRCDIAFVALKRDVRPLSTEVVERASLVALLPSRHRHARRRSLRFEDLEGERFIFLRQTSEPEIRAALLRRFAEAGRAPEVVLEIEQVDALLAFVAVGTGISLVPGFVDRLHHQGVTTVPIRPVVPCGISAVWDGATLSPVAERFLATLREERERESTARSASS
jgi:DNA-binding transcriptional LysR family regulator